MEILDIRGTTDTPKVLFDPDNNIFEISGRSLPEDVITFYQPVIEWLDDYELCKSAGEAARRYSEKHLHPNILIDKLASHFE